MSQRYGPSIDGDPLLIVNATSGAEAIQLPPGFAGGRSFFVRRTDSSGNTVTVSTITGGSINGTTNGTTTVPGNAEVRFTAGDANAWTSIGGATSGGTPGPGSVTSTELAAAAVTAGKIATGAVGTSEITDSSVALIDLAGAVQTAIAGLVPTGVKTSAYTAAAWDYIPVDTTSGAVTITLPTAPADGARLGVKHVIQGSTNAVTVQTGGSDVYNKAGGGTGFTLPLVNQGVLLQYRASGAIWYIQADDIPLSQLDTRFAATADSRITAAGTNKVGYYIPAGWGSFWKTARNNAGSGLARIACVGDSLTVGQYCSDLATKSYPGQLATSLQTSYGDGGSGYFSSFRTTLAIGGSYVPAGLATLSGTWTVNTGVCDGPGASVLKGASAGCSATFSVRGSTVDVFLLSGINSGFATYQVAIDGGTATTAVATNTGTAGIITRSFTGLSTGTHTVVVSSPDSTTTPNLFLIGVSGRNTTGVVVDNYGRSSFGSLAFANQSASTWVASGVTYGGSSNGTYAPAGKWSGGSARPADLIIYSHGVNDAHYASPTSPDTFIRNVRQFLDDVKSANNGAQDVIILLQHTGTGIGIGGSAFEDTTTAYYANYCGRLRSLCDVYGAAMVNLWALARNSYSYWNSLGYWGNSAVSTGAAGTDAVHLSEAGFTAVRDALLPVVTAS